jgi:3',5'-cyclic-AMP phosphodiesterase
MRSILWAVILVWQLGDASGQRNFSFVFLPDIHLQPDSANIANFEHCAGQINTLHPDFILTGGDMIYTAKNVDDIKAKVLFDLMDKEFKLFKMPVYMMMGNHEHVGITGDSGIDKTNPMWGKQMYEKRYGNRFYSFYFRGWKFFVLDGIRILEKDKDYTQGVDSIQINWLKRELDQTGKNVPVVLAIHPPLINPHAMTDSQSQALSESSETLLNLFKDHDLKMVLQGHNHIYMNLFINGRYYLSGGSTAYGTDANDYGIPYIKVKNDHLTLRFAAIQDSHP